MIRFPSIHSPADTIETAIVIIPLYSRCQTYKQKHVPMLYNLMPRARTSMSNKLYDQQQAGAVIGLMYPRLPRAPSYT